MNKKLVLAVPLTASIALGLYTCGGNDDNHADLNSVKNIVVIYAENRSFDNLYGNFPGANGLQNVDRRDAHAARSRRQRAGDVAADLGRADGERV